VLGLGVNVEKLPNRVTLSEALSWLAFGITYDKDKLKSELVSSAFGHAQDDALNKLTVSLEELATAARSGQITLEGRYVPDEKSGSALTTTIAPMALADFRAFDIKEDGLRRGKGVLWISNQKMEWVYNPNFSIEHYGDITMNFKELRDCLRKGTSPKHSTTADKPKLSVAALQQWWQSLLPQERAQSQAKLMELCDKTHPDHSITRQRIRDLTGTRKTGPKPIPPK
jgi:hypothetical protein